MEEYEQLLHEIKKLSNKYKRDKQFNAFTTFGVNEKENMHSRFIAMLLNPKGDHKCDDRFLDLFLKQLEINNFNLDGLKVECEKDAKGRRIDIAIWNPTHFLLIENKLWASDQDNQLRDYYNFAIKNTKNNDNVFIIYLTPYGAMPSEISFSTGIKPEGDNDLPKDKVICISYEKHILQWLEACIDSINASDNIRLKISLEMYVELIRKVIKRDKYMTEILKHILESTSNLEIAIDIVNAFKYKNFLLDDYFGKIIVQQILSEAYNHDCEVVDDSDGPWIVGKWYSIELINNGVLKGTICFDGASIYAKKNSQNQILFNEILCTNLSDSNLINLILQNKEGVRKWMNEIVDYFEIYK
jgi:hypothetical protein